MGKKMTEAITFDTHKFVKNLTEHGFSLEQAEALAAEQVNLLNSNLATKADLSNLVTRTDLSNLVTKTDLAELKADLLKWMIGALIAQGGLIVALISLLG